MKSILVLWYGWVVVGVWNKKEKTVEDAYCIRRWGTTKGLGELRDGPLPSTILEPLGNISISQKPLLVLEAKGWK
jgi:hypothetical protein